MARVALRVKVARTIGHSIEDSHCLGGLKKYEHDMESDEEVSERTQEDPVQAAVIRAAQEILFCIDSVEREYREK